MRNWDSNINNDFLGNPNDFNDICPQEKDYNDALELCNKLGIKLHRIDFIKEYWDYVFTYFLEELKKEEHLIQICYVINLLSLIYLLKKLKD